MSFRVLIAGCGYVGTELGLRLAARGHRVWGLRRTPSVLPHPLQSIRADLSNPGELTGLPKGLTHICYAASADRSSEEAYIRAYVLGLRHLLDLKELRSPTFQQFLFVSSTAVYEQNDGSWVNEESETKPQNFSGKRLLQAEELLKSSGLPFSILRCAGIYGPGRDRLIRIARAGQATYAAEAPKYTNRIHRDDAAAALAHLMSRPALNRLLVGADSDPATQKDVYEWLCERLGASPPIPATADSAARSGRSGSNKRCNNRQLIQAGYRFLYPTFREGYASML